MNESFERADRTDASAQMSATEAQYRRMTETPVNRLVLELGLPTTISMLVTSIYNMADTYYVSDIGSSASGAIGVVFALMAIIQAFGFMYGHGAGSNIGRLLGDHDTGRAGVFASTSFTMGLASGILIAVLGLVFQKPFMRLLGSTETILPYACDYSRYILLAAPVMVVSCIMNNILRYEGRATYAMIGLVSGGLINILGDYLLVYRWNMGVAGAGIATAFSQCIGAVILLVPFITGKTQSKLKISHIEFTAKTVGSIIAIGLPSMMRQGLNSISTMILNKSAQPYGDEAIAAMSIVARVVGFMFCVGLGIGQGFQPVAGFNYGAKKYSRVRESYRFTLAFGMVLLGFIGVGGFIFAGRIIASFTEDPLVVEIGIPALRFQSASLAMLPITVTGNMLFQSTGQSVRATFLAMTRSGLFFIPTLLILSRVIGLRGIQSAQMVADVLAALVTIPIVMYFLRGLPEDGGEESGGSRRAKR